MEPFQTAKIVEWSDGKGYGFLQVGGKRVFLHRRDFAEHHKRPAVGDVIRFTLGSDAKGRPCARNAVHVNDGGCITPLAVVMWLALLALPLFACWRRGVDWRWVAIYAVVASTVSYVAYALDKRRARRGAWRISESSLHLTELLGGWPGAFLAQRRLRHKVSKPEFQVVFWAIVLGYQAVAVDSVQDWRVTRAVWNRIHQHSAQAQAPARTPVIEIITNAVTTGNK